ncbi:MAG: exosortase/archaeosortase family protein [Planctomycetota bacterium]
MRRVAWLLAGAALLALALPRTSASAWMLLTDPAPRALAAGIPILALVWTWLILHGGPARCGSSGRWAGAALALLAAGSCILLVVAGASLEHRMLLFAPLATALVLASGGWTLLRQLAGPLALLLLAWPPLHDAVARASTPGLLALCGVPGVALARWAGADVVAIPGGGDVFVCQGPEGPLLAGLDASCSGASGLLSLIVLAIPVIAMRRPSRWRAIAWLGLGFVIVLGGNIVRIALLFWLAACHGCDAWFAQVHGLAGSIIVLVVWIGMLAALPMLGHRPTQPLLPEPEPETQPRRRAPMLACVLSFVACMVVEVNDSRWNPPPQIPLSVRTSNRVSLPQRTPAETEPPVLERTSSPAPISAPPPVAPAPVASTASPRPKPLRPLELMPAVPGWQRWAHGSFPWAAGLFGPEARAERLVYRRGEGRLIWMDVLICPRPEDIDRHTIPGCFASHAYRIERQERWELRGQQVDWWIVADSGDLRWAVAAWTQSGLRFAGGVLARRCTLWRRVDAGIGDAELGELRSLTEGLLGAAVRR